jgi:hypothetical protein
MAGQPFPVNPVLTGIVIAYQNAEYIADRVLPRLGPPLPRQLFQYMRFDFAQAITVPDTKVGRKGEPGTVEFGGTEVEASTEDYGLDDVVPIDDINQAPAGYDPRNFAATRLMDLILLDREVRVANKVFDANTYPSGNKVTLSGTSQWSHASSNPIADIEDAMDAMIMRPNIAVMGRQAWSKLRRNPMIVASLSASGTDKGLATRRAVADLFELDDIHVGASWLNSAKPGQAPVRVRVWGKHCALLRSEKLASSTAQVPTFGWTAEYGTRVSGDIPEPKVGLRGAVRVRSGESVKEVIAASDLGYLFTNAVA